jgi:putative phosphoesterase
LPATTTARDQLRLRADGSFRFAVVADTHSKPHPAIAQRLAELAPDAILHGGDIGELTVLDELAKQAPVLAVRGNIDRPSAVPERRVIELFGGDTVQLRILLVHIAVYGPRLRAEVARAAQKERASLVVCGHSHVPFIGQDRGLSVFNPGSIGPRRFALPIVLGAVEISAGRARLRHIDCETGNAWTPGSSGASRQQG